MTKQQIKAKLENAGITRLKYRVQIRALQERRYARCSRQSRPNFTRWLTVSTHDSLLEAEREFQRHTGLNKQARVVLGRKVLAELR